MATWTLSASGVIVKALESGLIADIVGATRQAQEAQFADKSRKILGVTAFPNADDKPVEVDPTRAERVDRGDHAYPHAPLVVVHAHTECPFWCAPRSR